MTSFSDPNDLIVSMIAQQTAEEHPDVPPDVVRSITASTLQKREAATAVAGGAEVGSRRFGPNGGMAIRKLCDGVPMWHIVDDDGQHWDQSPQLPGEWVSP